MVVEIIGKSKALATVLERANRVARTRISVLIEGETGTGKELLARHIHERSDREDGPFVAVNCAAIPRDLIESELFGHERGAFTGAASTRLGAFERAHGGTLFLDEIGDMPLDQQTKILRVIQEREVQRVGAASPRAIDVRLVVATNRNLQSRSAVELFRQDLYQRVAGYTLVLPPLRERGADIVAIASSLLQREFPSVMLSASARSLLLRHRWPGNIRELQNVVRAGAIDARAGRIDAKTLALQPSFAQPAKSQDARSDAERLAAVRALLRQQQRITATDVRALLHLQRAHTNRLLAVWERSGELIRHGCGRATFYVDAHHDEPSDELRERRLARAV